MGANDFVEEGIGIDPREVFQELCRDARDMYGSDPYNGTISTTSLGVCRKRFDRANKTNEKKAWDFVEAQDGGRKWTADYVDVGVVGYIAYSVKIVPSTTTKKIQNPKEYRVRLKRYTGEVVERVYSSKGEAENEAVFKGRTSKGEIADISVVALVEQPNGKRGVVPVSKVKVTRKEYKTRPKEAQGRQIYEVHKYIFYGMAAS